MGAVLAGIVVVSRALRRHGAPPRGPAVQLHRPDVRPRQHRLSGDPRLHGICPRRVLGRRLGRQPAEVGLAARSPHRLHPRDHRRGARAVRQPRRAAAVRAVRGRRHPRRHAHQGRLRPLRRGRHRDLDPLAGHDQHGHGSWPAAGHRHSAPADLSGRLEPVRDPGGVRHSAELRDDRDRARARPRCEPGAAPAAGRARKR